MLSKKKNRDALPHNLNILLMHLFGICKQNIPICIFRIKHCQIHQPIIRGQFMTVKMIELQRKLWKINAILVAFEQSILISFLFLKNNAIETRITIASCFLLLFLLALT